MNKCVIFDMDGTIYNSLEDLANSVNYALQKCGLPTHEVENYKKFLGEGVFVLIKKAITEEYYTDNIFNKVKSEYDYHYNKNLNNCSKPYDGILEMLKSLKNRGVKLAVCSNKPHSFCKEICDISFNGIFDYALGQSEKYMKKPNPDMILAIMNKFGLNRNNSVYVGDSEIDIMAGLNAEIQTIGVTYGFRTKEELIDAGAEYLCDNVHQLDKTIDLLLR